MVHDGRAGVLTWLLLASEAGAACVTAMELPDSMLWQKDPCSAVQACLLPPAEGAPAAHIPLSEMFRAGAGRGLLLRWTAAHLQMIGQHDPAPSCQQGARVLGFLGLDLCWLLVIVIQAVLQAWAAAAQTSSC